MPLRFFTIVMALLAAWPGSARAEETGQGAAHRHECLTTLALFALPEADHAEAARLMEKEGIKRLPVVQDGRLVGLISRADMLRAYARADSEVVAEISDHVMREILWIDPRRVTVECSDGNVVLKGQLETRSDVSLLVELTKRLDGVTSVADQLTFEVDNTKLEMVSPPAGFPRHNW